MSSLLLTSCQQLTECATPIDCPMILMLFTDCTSFLAHRRTQRFSSFFLDSEGLRMHNDTIVVLRSGDAHEAAVDFAGYDRGRACEGVAEAAAAPGYPFKDVAFESVSVHEG
jgi:hypothetical protein